MTDPIVECVSRRRTVFRRNENSDVQNFARIQVGKSSEIKEDRLIRLITLFAEQVIVVVLVDWIVVDVLVK